MPTLDPSLIDSIANLDPVRLAILFMGLIGLGVVWLTYLIVKHLGRRK
jgi:hypothetical protein